jgi:hypothetical protein
VSVPPDIVPVRYRPGSVWSPVRDAVLRQMWHDGAHETAILDAVNSLPGAGKVSSPDAVSNRAARLKLRRSPGAMVAIRAANAARAKQAWAMVKADPLLIAPPWGTIGPSAEQEQLIRELWPQKGLPRADIHRRYNDLGPHQVPKSSYLYPIAVRLGVHCYGSQPKKGKRPVGRPPAGRQADPMDPLAALPDDDLAEARAIIRRRGGWRDLAAHFGWPEREAIAIAAALRDDLTRPELATRSIAA